LEEMEVALVNEGDRSAGTLEGLRGDEPAKTSAENKNFVCAGHREPTHCYHGRGRISLQ